MKEHRFTLERYTTQASRYRCPSCNKDREFTRYIDLVTGQHLADYVGKCNRLDKCGYHYPPKEFFKQHPTFHWPEARQLPAFKATPTKVDLLPADAPTQSIKNATQNHFFTALARWVGYDKALEAFKRYGAGSSSHWPRSTAFWQYDTQHQVRQCKVMLYNPDTGKRTDKVHFAGKGLLKNGKANLRQCFFGEHLLAGDPDRPVALVESEKTAMLASVMDPGFIWLATGGKHGCRWTDPEVGRVLTGRTVILFPDLGAYDLWTDKAAELSKQVFCRILVSDELEKQAPDTDKEEGKDLADYWIEKLEN